jgi:sulfatase maturation enzyme AslB (radical SAM superfamily)
MSYLFEEHSAEVIGEILSAEKNGRVSIDDVSLHTLIEKESIIPFFAELVQLGLLTLEMPTTHSIDIYRRKIGKMRKEHPQVIKYEIKEDLPQELSGAEKDYFNKVGGISNVMFELTYNCSEKCIHCFNPGATRNDREISKRGDRIELELDDYRRIIDELYDLGLTKACLSGGDPFSKPIAWEIIDYLYHKGIATDIFTNGQSIVHDVQRLANYYPSVVGISIYSGIAEDHDYITRIKGSWERSMSVVKQLSDLGVPMNLKCCIMRPNVKSYHLVADIAKQYGAVPQFAVSLINSLEGDKCVSRYLRLPSEVLELVLRDNNVSLYVGKERQNYGGRKLL